MKLSLKDSDSSPKPVVLIDGNVLVLSFVL